ncbi:alanine racemase [Caviibacter abscessus]|nr:alanine racemase [Caviibacter abscessus]
MSRSQVIINLKNVEYNIEKIFEFVPKQKLMAVIKADAYGHGAVKIYELCIKKGIKWFGVATYKEAMQLYRKNNNTNILILSPIEKKYYKSLSKYGIHFTVSSFEDIEYINKHNLKCNIHLAYDTGMGRIGFNDNDIRKAIKLSNPKGIFTHLSVSESDDDYTKKQIEKFNNIALSSNIEFKHALNSYGSFKFAKKYTNYDLYRVGIMIYGGDDTGLFKQALSFYSRVNYVKKLDKDSFIGYGNTYKAKKNDYIATISVGYADGIRRDYSKDGKVYINGKYYKIIGNICMDQFMVLVDENVKIGDKVEIIGEHITLNEIAKAISSISYEILCSIGKRVYKKYKENNL